MRGLRRAERFIKLITSFRTEPSKQTVGNPVFDFLANAGKECTRLAARTLQRARRRARPAIACIHFWIRPAFLCRP